jgi:hypothetical protein
VAGNWIDKISRAWARGPANTLALARLLHQARQSMKHGQWSHIWRSPRLPFSKRKAEMLVTVGEVLGGLNAKNSAHLPTAWNTLYYIAQLGQTLTEQLIGEGRIHPRFLLRQARELVAEHRPGGFANVALCLRSSGGWTASRILFWRARQTGRQQNASLSVLNSNDS